MSAFLPDYPAAEVRPSPNHGERKDGRTPDMLLLHYTGMPTAEAALHWLTVPESEVSSHYMVFEDGRVVQMVPEARRAWHAGRSFWKGETDMTPVPSASRSPIPAIPADCRIFRLSRSTRLSFCRDLVARHAIPAERVLAHSDVAPVRKVDPGENFPWERLADAGVGHFVEPAPIGGGRFFQRGDSGPPVEALQAMLGLYGYNTPVSGEFCARTEGDVAAFQRHFRRQRVDGIADFSTIDTLHRLLKTLPSG